MGRLCLRIPHACVPWWLPSHTTFLSKQFFCVPSFAFLRSYVPNFASPSWFSILNRKLITYTVYIHLPCPPPYSFAFHVPLLLYKICIPRSLVTFQNLHSHSSEAQERGNRNLLMQNSHRNYEWFLSHLSLQKIGWGESQPPVNKYAVHTLLIILLQSIKAFVAYMY